MEKKKNPFKEFVKEIEAEIEAEISDQETNGIQLNCDSGVEEAKQYLNDIEKIYTDFAASEAICLTIFNCMDADKIFKIYDRIQKRFDEAGEEDWP